VKNKSRPFPAGTGGVVYGGKNRVGLGIDIGNTSLKALRLSNESGTLEVIGFDHILHGKVLSGSGIKDQEKQELIAISLRQFVQANDLGRDEIIVAVPAQTVSPALLISRPSRKTYPRNRQVRSQPADSL